MNITPVSLLAVASGGALGASLRFLVAVLSRQGVGGAFPLGTLTVNLLGCLLIGLAASAFAAGEGGGRIARRNTFALGLARTTLFLPPQRSYLM